MRGGPGGVGGGLGAVQGGPYGPEGPKCATDTNTTGSYRHGTNFPGETDRGNGFATSENLYFQSFMEFYRTDLEHCAGQLKFLSLR